MSEPFLGEIRMVGWSFAPRGWAQCNGQLMSIQQNTALFSLLGTTYGGDGRVTFGLPDLRGRVPMHQGSGPGLTSRVMGEVDGTETVTLLSSQLPAHNHGTSASDQDSTAKSPANNVPAFTSSAAYTNSANVAMQPTGVSGGSQPHDNVQPILVINFVISLVGIYPSRN